VTEDLYLVSSSNLRLCTFLQGRFSFEKIEGNVACVSLLCLDWAQLVLAKNLSKGEIVGYLYVGFTFA